MTTRPAVVGTFVVGAFVLGILLILFFGGMRLFAKTSSVVTFFDESVAGLEPGAPVTFHGVRVGSVKSISVRFSTEHILSAQVPVLLELQEDSVVWDGRRLSDAPAEYDRLISAGLRAQLAMQSFVTGQLRVEMDFRPNTPVNLVGLDLGIPELPTLPSEIGQMRNKLEGLDLQQLAHSAQAAFISVTRLADHVNTVIDPLMDSGGQALRAFSRTMETTDEAVRNLQGEATKALRDFDALAGEAHRQLGLRGGELSHTLASADRAARQAEALLSNLNNLTERRSPLRENLESTVRDLSSAASALRGFAETVERDPNVLLLGRGR
ncbi:paraquat-inducible protein B [Enhydrobacter aerosaccus]|uniref:Paraquat-inducible protein B n=1 Tax=Enhydrobacter aerosaccus TaxID=225324 RepID=A0A1T4TJ22_9HYPH|nr:MlaD family protein [Enhydrobacter aerosaccus]SKA40486.1 paraquat-inducible protein B [Enhydrobacter aerosaccus]